MSVLLEFKSCFLSAKIRRSTPEANPTAGVGFPPSCSINPLYLPPPHRASCAPNMLELISKVVML